MSTIRLEPLCDAHWSALEKFTLPLEQEKYTTLPKDIDSIIPNGVHPVVIMNDTPVGFFLLHDTERVQSYTDNPNALLLSVLSINHPAQGNGYAKSALQQLPEYVHHHFSGKQQVVLSVNLKNETAFSLYQTVGFTDTGRRMTGPVGEQRIMSLTV